MVSSLIQIITMLTVLIAFGFTIVLGTYIFYKSKKDEDFDSVDRVKGPKEKDSEKKETAVGGKFHGVLNTESIYNIMDFDNVVDGMILRKNKTQYIMVLACNGINFDLRSEEEKLSIEEGFQQFLNIIKYPVQLYIQTRGLNYDNLINGYKDRLRNIEEDIKESDIAIQKEKQNGNNFYVEKELSDKRRKINIKEYAEDTISYVNRLSNSKNVLHQKAYVVVSYYTAEIGPKIANYSKEEIQDMVFDELYTRCSNLSSALMSSGVSSRVLNSEELIELLFNAYNRDATEFMTIENHLDAEYDALYTTAKEVLEKRKEKLEKEISLDAVDLATSSIVKASKKRRAELEAEKANKQTKVKEAAKEYIEGYRDKLDQVIYESALKGVDETELDEISEK